jgi:hypothetical protein
MVPQDGIESPLSIDKKDPTPEQQAILDNSNTVAGSFADVHAPIHGDGLAEEADPFSDQQTSTKTLGGVEIGLIAGAVIAMIGLGIAVAMAVNGS